MDLREFYFERSHVPAFGKWDCYDDMPFTHCFESARQTGLLRYSYSEEEERDLYENHILTPAMILIPRSIGKTGWYQNEKEGKKDARLTCQFDLETVAKAVDEDLYKISPHILRQHDKKRGWGIFSS